jgi:hypothetical protein
MSRNSFSFSGFQGTIGEVRQRQSLPPDAPGLKETAMFWPQGGGRENLFTNPHVFRPILGQG